MEGNSINSTQNQEDKVRLLQARQQIYSSANTALIAQIILTLILPTVGAVVIIFLPDKRAYFAAASLVVLVVDAMILEVMQKVLLKRAANVSEQFDVAVLDLEWDEFSVGERLDTEDVSGAAREYARWHDITKLSSWYPPIVGVLPMHLARVVCQRINLVYDRRLRQLYANLLKFLCIAVTVAFVALGLVQGSSFSDFVLTTIPAIPFLSWAIREFRRQIDTADRMDALSREALKLWREALSGKLGEAECKVRSREFQTAIYQRRANSSLIIPLLYRLKRRSLEEETRDGVEERVREYHKQLKAAQRQQA